MTIAHFIKKIFLFQRWFRHEVQKGKIKSPAAIDAAGFSQSSSDGIRTRVSALRGPRPRPLDNGARKKKAGELGFEPRQYESES